MRISGIYKIRNLINGKVYVGSSSNIGERWKYHLVCLNGGYKHRTNPHLLNAWNKYGKQNFVFEIIETVAPLRQNLIEREQYWIDKHKSYEDKNGYNISPTAGSNLGVKKSEEGRKNLSLCKMGAKNPNYGKKPSPNVLKALSLRRGARHSEETIEKMRQSKYGNKSAVGEANGRSVLCEQQVTEIVDLLKQNKLTMKEIGNMYGITSAAVDHIRNGVTWKHITGGKIERIPLPRMGEQSGNNVLKTDEVKAIKHMLSSKKYSNPEIASFYGVALNTIKDIKRGRTWKNVVI